MVRSVKASRSWNLIKFAIYSVSFIGISLLAFLTTISYLAVKPLKPEAPYQVFFPAEVCLVVEALSVDPIARTITMDWYPSFAGLDCTKRPMVLDILLTQSLLDTSSPSWTAQPPYLPVYQLNSTEHCLDLIDVEHPSFRTVTKLRSSSMEVPYLSESGQSTLQNYPFDVYVAPFTFSTRNIETGAISALNVTNSFGVAVNFEISVVKSLFLTNEIANLPSQSRLELAFRVQRSKATKMFVVMVAITNWLTAAVFLIMCASALVYHSHEIYSEMFVVPMGAVFAFTSIRANFPGAPLGFGTTLDMYSTLPFLVIMSFCSATLFLLVLYRRICHAERDNLSTKRGVQQSGGIGEQEGQQLPNNAKDNSLQQVDRPLKNEVPVTQTYSEGDLENYQLGTDEILRRLHTL